MFELKDYNAFKIEFDSTTENGNLDKFMAKYLNIDAVGLPIQNESSKEDERRRLES